MRKYRVSGGRPVLDVEPGDELEHAFTAEEEATLLAQGRLEILPRQYRNTGARTVHGAEPGEEFEAALTVGQEQALLDAGHAEALDQRALTSYSRDELNALAKQKGIADPEALPNRKAVIQAIEAATSEPKE